MSVVYDPAQALHDPQFFLMRGKAVASPERASRGETLLAAAVGSGLRQVTPPALDEAWLATVHEARYLAFLAEAWVAWQAIGGGGEVVANVHPQRAHASYPDGIVGRAGWHMGDTACPLGEHSFSAAKAAAASAIHATRLVLEGAGSAYALCRPPGHHAYADMAAGFCFLNNAALAAAVVRAAEARVAILDVDVHHGNGTQAIFYDRSDVLHVSLHADPRLFYPWFWGYAGETGEGAGQGYNVNLPLPLGTDDRAYLVALEAALDRVAAHRPDVLVVALGLDIHEGDPLAGFRVTADGFARIAERIAQRRWPTVLVQEGGYPSPALGQNLERFLAGWSAA
ncbi:MAG: histone deacetylase family protein [Geminicoccaceae bacterium]|nr:MAG: histone deacetylase family protein [Geminicoccaceae bacterium]